MHIPKDSFAFVDYLADVLRLPDETLAMTYLYTNKYNRFWISSEMPDPLDSYVCVPIDFATSTMLSIPHASLSLASKATESPRRLREILFPAHRLLNPSSNPPLKAPSELYDVLRTTVVQAELVLLRVLGFDLRLSLPLEYIPRYLERAMAEVADVGEDYRGWEKEEREEYGVVGDLMETGVGRACRSKVIAACKNPKIANLFPARTAAAACLFVVLEDRGLQVEGSIAEWVQVVTSRKVDSEDFDEAIAVMKEMIVAGRVTEM